MKVFLALSFLSIVSGEYLEGYHLDVPLLKSLKDVGLRSCCKECSAYTNCQSVNYNKNDFSCELNYHHLSGLSGKTALNESVYMDRDHCFTLASCSAVSKQHYRRESKFYSRCLVIAYLLNTFETFNI